MAGLLLASSHQLRALAATRGSARGWEGGGGCTRVSQREIQVPKHGLRIREAAGISYQNMD